MDRDLKCLVMRDLLVPGWCLVLRKLWDLETSRNWSEVSERIKVKCCEIRAGVWGRGPSASGAANALAGSRGEAPGKFLAFCKIHNCRSAKEK